MRVSPRDRFQHPILGSNEFERVEDFAALQQFRVGLRAIHKILRAFRRCLQLGARHEELAIQHRGCNIGATSVQEEK